MIGSKARKTTLAVVVADHDVRRAAQRVHPYMKVVQSFQENALGAILN